MREEAINAVFSPSETPFAAHSRAYAANRYVYPVLSRRAGGLSIGVNLNTNRHCNFRCVYCQVDRSTPATGGPVDLAVLAAELDRMLDLVLTGEIYRGAQFRQVPDALRRLNDIALSGDGEPTACPDFEEAVDLCAAARRRRKLDDLKIVLITNATLFHKPRVRRALEILDANNGEIWAKLDAGTEEYYRQVDRSAVPWRRVLENLREAARARPIVIQSLFLRMHGLPMPPEELAAYCCRLHEIVSAGGRIKLIQLHTIARTPAEPWVAPLADAEVDAFAAEIRGRTGLPVAVYYSA